MNIKNIDMSKYHPSEENLFDDMMVRQYELMEMLKNAGKIKELPDGKHKPQMTKDSIRRSLEEMYEADLCLKNKKWKATEVLTDTKHFKEELADSIHFYLEAIMFFPHYEEVDIEKLIEDTKEKDIHSKEIQKTIKNQVFGFTTDCVSVVRSHSKYNLRHGLFTLFDICKKAGMNAQEIHDTYIKKWKVNKWRIETNY